LRGCVIPAVNHLTPPYPSADRPAVQGRACPPHGVSRYLTMSDLKNVTKRRGPLSLSVTIGRRLGSGRADPDQLRSASSHILENRPGRAGWWLEPLQPRIARLNPRLARRLLWSLSVQSLGPFATRGKSLSKGR